MLSSCPRLPGLACGLALALCAFGAQAGQARGQFMVSVRVLPTCHIGLPSATAGALSVNCTRDTGYRLILDGRVAQAGVGTGATQILPLSAIPAGHGDLPDTAHTHWLTILY